ncbi:uncharacterized protein LAJ45_09618 [Morchella importuna]|uniref:uncharacterized protein n=1 Tax=Morchella importuna TaxID=1174673 RepID=UPI001E8E5D4C|nr:uncharacterized protein LAJ45_09618 [Morchella importuna]KAH8146425.1 hypothetical protein LAJ45_09618 [Morchella importuna]
MISRLPRQLRKLPRVFCPPPSSIRISGHRLFSSGTSTTPADAASSQPPPTAPKQTPPLRLIRDAADYHTANCINRNYPSLSANPARIVALHSELTALENSARSAREEKNADHIATLTESESRLQEELRSLALALPNRTHAETPVGAEPRLLGYINEGLANTTDWAAKKSHTDIGAELGLLDFASASTVSGWGWYYLLDDLVLLEQALINYALTTARASGWRLVSPPSIVYSHIASAAGFRPRDANGEQQVYALETADGKIPHSLAGTAEIPLAGLGAGRVFEAAELPLKVVGAGRAYRAEAGARGVESKGLYRVHEFTKVELFAWAPADDAAVNDQGGNVVPAPDSAAERVFKEMLVFQKNLISSLGLYARVLEMPTQDLGASACRKIDIEVYMPSRLGKDPWGEVSSLSNCTDYQARRLDTRVKDSSGGRGFVWTLNGTAVAVPRMLIALLEYGYEEGVGVRVPEVLRPFMGGVDVIRRR